jgi:hypothetical protein
MIRGRVNVAAAIKQNDYTNLLTDRSFKTSTLFKSILVNVRVPRYPVLSAGYYPASQFFIVNKDKVVENAYYVLNASTFYTYQLGAAQLNSSVIYNRFFNKATDTGFVSYKGLNYIINQNIIVNKLQLLGSFSINNQPEIYYYTTEAGIDYELLKFLRVGGSIKINKISKGERYFGHLARIAASFNKTAGIQVSYEKSYLPTTSETLFPVQTGRVSLFKTF